MFALVPTAEAARTRVLLAALTSPLPLVEHKALEFVLGDHTLLWARSRAYDDVIHADGQIYLGTSASTASPQERANAPLASGVLLRHGEGVRLDPIGLRGVFFDAAARLSDSTLLLAALTDNQPSWARVIELAAGHALFGRHSLFRTITRLAPLQSAEVRDGQLRFRNQPVPSPATTEEDFVAILCELVQMPDPAVLALTGGYDSRLVLGALRRSDRRLVTTHQRWRANDEAVARRVADAAGYEFVVVDDTARARVSDISYVIATDAQVTYRAGSLSSIAGVFDRIRPLYTGQFADVSSKNAFPTAFVGHPPTGDPVSHLVDRKLFRDASSFGCDLAAVRSELISELHDLAPPIDVDARKGIVGWHYYSSRGLRWIEGQHADIALFHEVLSPLGDLRLVFHGMRASTWDDLGHERSRRLNESLGVGFGIAYSDGGPASATPGLARARRRVEDALKCGTFGQLRLKRQGKPGRPGKDLSESDLSALSSGMADGDAETIYRTHAGRDERRAMRTAAHACRVLEALRTDDPVAGVGKLDRDIAAESS